MEITSTPMVAMFVLYIVAMLLIGWFGYKATTDLSDYILGGRRLGSFVVYSSDADTQFQRLWPIHAGDSDHPFQ